MTDLLTSDDGTWVWDGVHWSAKNAAISGSMAGRFFGWSILGGLPVGAIAGAVVGSTIEHLNHALGIVIGIGLVVAIEAVAIYLVYRWTPRISIENGVMRVGNVGDANLLDVYRVADVASIDIVRGNRGLLYATEGFEGEGRVLITFAGNRRPIELEWDAFFAKAQRLAWFLGVPLIDSADSGKQAHTTATDER